MSRARTARSARARANMAIRLLKTIQPWPRGRGMGRSFDDCFEMGDGNEVCRRIIAAACNDCELRNAMKRHGCNDWLEAVRAKLSSTEEHQQLLF